MFIVRLQTNLDTHTYTVDGGHASAPYKALLEMYSAFETWCKDWREPVFISIMSDIGAFYKSPRLGAENIITNGEVWIPLNNSAKTQKEARERDET